MYVLAVFVITVLLFGAKFDRKRQNKPHQQGAAAPLPGFLSFCCQTLHKKVITNTAKRTCFDSLALLASIPAGKKRLQPL